MAAAASSGWENSPSRCQGPADKQDECTEGWGSLSVSLGRGAPLARQQCLLSLAQRCQHPSWRRWVWMQHPCASLCSVSWAQPHRLGFGPQSLGQSRCRVPSAQQRSGLGGGTGLHLPCRREGGRGWSLPFGASSATGCAHHGGEHFSTELAPRLVVGDQ